MHVHELLPRTIQGTFLSISNAFLKHLHLPGCLKRHGTLCILQEWDPNSELFEFMSEDATAPCSICYEDHPLRRLQRFQCCGTLTCYNCLLGQVKVAVIVHAQTC